MSASLRRLLLALALACSGLMLLQLPAEACICGGRGVQGHARSADVVFSGLLTQAERGRNRDVYTLDVERIYQGRVDDTPVEVMASKKFACGVELRVDRTYLMFAREDGSRLTTGGCTGTDRATPAYLSDVERVLGPGTAITKPPPSEQDPPKPEFSRVEGADPTEFTRLAAPGGAMVLLGLLGLILFRKRD